MDDNLNVKLTDFGFATELDDDEEMYGEWYTFVRLCTVLCDQCSLCCY